jgi:hypothetical protein
MLQKAIVGTIIAIATFGYGCVAATDGDDASSAALRGGEGASEGTEKAPPKDPRGPKGDCEEPRDPGEARACFGNVLTAEVCIDNADWKVRAAAACAERGAELVAIGTNDACGAKGSTSVKFECCGGKEEPPPPPPPPRRCFSDVIATKQCVDPGLLKERARAICESRRTSLADIAHDAACGDRGATSVKFTCCGEPEEPPPPPPPPRKCFADLLEFEQCIDPIAVKGRVIGICSEAGAVVTEYWPNEACGARGSSAVKYECCVEERAEPLPREDEPRPAPRK